MIGIIASSNIQCLDGTTCETNLPTVAANSSTVQTVLQLVFGIVAALTVIYIIVAALKFITAQGNPQEAAKARQTIVYAVIGLVVALSAEAIVTFTLNKL